MKPRRTTWTLSALALTTTAFAQQPLSFEVASIKPSDHPSMGTIQIGMDSDAGMVRYTNISLKDCIRAAALGFGLHAFDDVISIDRFMQPEFRGDSVALGI